MRVTYKWWLVAILWLICFSNYADRQAIFSVFPLLRREFDLSDLQMGVVASSFMWLYAVSGPLAGWVSDRVSPKKVVLAALTFWSLVTWGTGLSANYPSLVLFRALGGFSEAFYIPAAMALIALYHGSETRSRAMAIHQSSVYAGTIAGGSIAGILAEHHDWRYCFECFGLSGLILVPLVGIFIRATRPSQGILNSEKLRFRDGIQNILRNPNASAMIAIFFGANFVAMIFLAWLPSFLVERFHMSIGKAGIYSTLYLQAASVAGVLIGGILGDRAATKPGNRQKVQTIGLLLGFPFLLLIGQSTTIPAFVMGVLGFGFAKGVYDGNLWASLYDVVLPECRGIAAGTMNSIGWIGGALSSFAVALAAHRFGFGICLSATSVIYLLLAIRMRGVAARVKQHPQSVCA